MTDEPVTNRLKGKSKEPTTDNVVIEPLRQAVMTIPIVGESPLKILRFSQKSKDTVRQTQEAGSQAKSKKKRDPKNFEELYEQAKYLCTQEIDGKKVTWLGLNASGIRNGAIEACRVSGFVMTKAKMTIFCEADGFDDIDGTPLVRIYGEPKMSVDPVRNASGVIDLRPRVQFLTWRMKLRIRFDESQFSPSDVVNLIIRVGQQNGLGEGRPNGSNGNGTGNGIFRIEDVEKCEIMRMSHKTVVFDESR